MSLQVLWCETCKRVVSKHHGGDLHRDHQAATATIEALLESRDQRIKRLVAVAKAGTKLMTAEVEVHNSGGELGALDHALGGLSPGDLDAGAEADPDVADTAWAIIAHHRQHRTAG